MPIRPRSSSSCPGRPPRLPRPGTPALRRLAVALLTAAAVGGALAQADPRISADQYYDEARTLYERQDFAGAIIQLKNALQKDRRLLAAQLLLGKALLATGEYRSAEATLEEALAMGVSKAEVVSYLGQVYLLLGEPAKLLDTFAVAGVPEALQGELQTMRGSAYAMSGNLVAAQAAFAEARRLNPKSADPLAAEVPILLRLGELEKARAAARRASELAPNNAVAWQQLGTVQQAAGELQPALASFDKAAALNPKLVDALVARATVLMALHRNEEAARQLAELAAAKVIEPRASFMRATLAAAAGDEKTAKAEYAEAAARVDALPPGLRTASDAVLLTGALAHRALGNGERAREYVDVLLTRNPRHFQGQLLLAQLLLDGRELGRATTLLDNLARIAPKEPQVLYLLGQTQLAKKQYARAAELFERALVASGGSAAKGGSSDARRELAFAQFGLGREREALANLEAALAQNPRDPRAGTELAIYHARRGQGAKAVKIAEDLVKASGGDLAMLNFLGNIKGRLGDNAGMRAVYEQVLAKDPKYRQTIINLSMLDIDEGKFDVARARLAGWVKDNPGDGEAWFQLGALEQRAGQPQQALDHWARAEGLPVRDPRPGLARVSLLLQMPGRVPEGLAAARSLAAKYPEAVPVLMALAQAQLASREPASAVQSLQEASKYAGSDAAAQLQVARMLLAANNTAAARHALSKAQQSAPEDIDVLAMQVEIAARERDAAAVDAALKRLQARHPGAVPTLLTSGHVALSRGQAAAAITHYKAAYAREASPPIALVLAQAYLSDKQPEQALALLEQTQKKFPRDANTLQALAQLLAGSGQQAKARDAYAALAVLRPSDPQVLAGYAMALQRSGDPKALAVAEQAMKLQPDNAALAGNYGWMLVQKGDLENGVRVLRDARLRAPADGGLRWALASALAKAGRKAEARDELRAALASTPSPPPGPELNALKAELGL